MREHAAEPRDPGFVAHGILRMLPVRIQDDEQCQAAVAMLIGALFRIAGHGVKE